MIILDLDGVLADFNSAANAVNNLPQEPATCWDWYKQHGMSTDEFWNNIHARGDSFYRDSVRPYSWWKEVVDLVTAADDFVIMTSPSNTPCGYAGKKIWVDEWLNIRPTQLIVGARKDLLAGSDRLLIDDNLDNISMFRRAGGHGFVFPQPWNYDHEVPNRIERLKNYLEHWERKMSR